MVHSSVTCKLRGLYSRGHRDLKQESLFVFIFFEIQRPTSIITHSFTVA